ncbi:Mucin-19 [Streptomyces sp. NPDC048565]|uniref:Mucin-19 n=1 Tax=Streptomyces sp. NPDC048565 TaxID=3155266 RepID=UPI00343741DE
MTTTQDYQKGLAELREIRDAIKPLQRQLEKLENDLGKLRARRDERVRTLAGYEQAKAERLATSAGVSVIDIVALAPSLGPQEPSGAPVAPEVEVTGAEDPREAQKAAQAIKESEGVLPSDLRDDQAADEAGRRQDSAPSPAAASAPSPTPTVGPAEPEKTLPSIPEGAPGDRWIYAEPNLLSTRPKFKQSVRQMAFLDAATGVLVWHGGTLTCDLGRAGVADILNAVYSTVPQDVERIYITAGDPWHRNAESHQFLRDAVAEWLNGPLPEGWQVEASRGKDRQAGHLVHPRNPVGRWQRGKEQHTEIRSVGEWFDPKGADPATVREAFIALWKALHEHWKDVVLMGSPSQTGRDLWSRTIPAKEGAQWADGYPVMSQEIRGLLHATAGQGRTELISPPRVPERVPGWYEVDRTFAYAKHTWMSGVGVPQRLSAARFAALSEKEQSNALFSPSHWQIRVTVPEGWDHVGLLPVPGGGDSPWHYPDQAGRTFTTWAGGAEVNLALRNPIQPWRIEILDGLVWQKGDPLKDWADKLKDAWRRLRAQSELHGDERQRTAAALASRAVRSILLYGIGTFAQRPQITTGSIQLSTGGDVPEIPDGSRLTGMTDTHVTWERNAGFSRNQYAHPEWSAGVWSAARAALLSGPSGAKDPATGKPAKAGALHLPAGSILAFRTDAIYSSVRPEWPYTGEPGDYLLKGAMPWEQTTPTTDAEFYILQGLGRQALEAEGL